MNFDFQIKENPNEKEVINEKNLEYYLVRIQFEVEKDNYTSGIGVLCNVPKKSIKVLITYNHFIDFDSLNKLKSVKICNKNDVKVINMKTPRFKCIYNEIDIAIIQILDEDKIYDFIELDSLINLRNYENEEVECVYFKEPEKLEFLDGKIKLKEEMLYVESPEQIKEGIIVLKKNLNLIGVIKEGKNPNEIEYLQMKQIINGINFIKCKYEIKHYDLGQDILLVANKKKRLALKKGVKKNEVEVLIEGVLKPNIQTYKFEEEGIYTVYFIYHIFLTNMASMFRNCITLKEIDFGSFNSSEVTSMAGLFFDCTSLEKINFTSIYTIQVTNMECMFYNCISLKDLNLSSVKTPKVKDMEGMFYNCCSLRELNLTSFKTKQVTNMSCMFSFCSSLIKLNVSSFDTTLVTNMSYMFCDCSSLRELNLESFNTGQVTNMFCMFDNCSSLKQLDLSNFYLDNVTDISRMFCNCTALNELNLNSFDTSKVNYFSLIFNNCVSLNKVKTKDKRILEKYKNFNKGN